MGGGEAGLGPGPGALPPLPLTLPRGAEIGSRRSGGGPGSGLISGSAGITVVGQSLIRGTAGLATGGCSPQPAAEAPPERGAGKFPPPVSPLARAPALFAFVFGKLRG